MKALNDWAIKNLGAWVTDCAALFLILAVGMLVILLITFIIAANRHARVKKKIRMLKEKTLSSAADGAENTAPSEDELRERIRAELEAERADAQTDGDIAEYSAAVERLTAENEAKQRTIDELNARLDSAAVTAQGADADGALRKRIDELSRANAELAEKNAELTQANIEFNETYLEQQNELSLLKAENAQIKAQALQQQLAAERGRTAAKATAERTAEPVKQTAPPTEKKPAAKAKKEEPAPSQEDEYDEYYDDYGDETSAIKVTLKFDRVKNNWVILRTDTDRAYRRLSTKQEALTVAKDLARRLHAQLVVHKKDGKFQRI